MIKIASAAAGIALLAFPAAANAAEPYGVWLRPFRDLIYTMPPFVSSDDDVATIAAAICAVAADHP